MKRSNTQATLFLDYLENNTATVSMVSKVIGVKQTSLTAVKRNLERQGLIIKLYKDKCKATGFKATYLTSTL